MQRRRGKASHLIENLNGKICFKAIENKEISSKRHPMVRCTIMGCLVYSNLVFKRSFTTGKKGTYT